MKRIRELVRAVVSGVGMALRRLCGLVIKIHPFLRRHKDFMQAIIAVGVIGSMLFTAQQACLLRKQIEIEIRPSVSIENAHWSYRPNTDWFTSDFVRKNYGGRPAVEFHFKNFRAIILKIHDSSLQQKVRARTPSGQAQYVQEYFEDERNRLILNLLELVAEYFLKHPDAKKKEVGNFLGRLEPKSPEVREREILLFEKQLLFRVVEVNNDMDEYYRRLRVVVFPGDEKRRGLKQQMGSDGVRQVIEDSNVLIVYWAVGYKDIEKMREYESFYVGYCDRRCRENREPTEDEWVGNPPREFRSWAR